MTSGGTKIEKARYVTTQQWGLQTTNAPHAMMTHNATQSISHNWMKKKANRDSEHKREGGKRRRTKQNAHLTDASSIAQTTRITREVSEQLEKHRKTTHFDKGTNKIKQLTHTNNSNPKRTRVCSLRATTKILSIFLHKNNPANQQLVTCYVSRCDQRALVMNLFFLKKATENRTLHHRRMRIERCATATSAAATFVCVDLVRNKKKTDSAKRIPPTK